MLDLVQLNQLNLAGSQSSHSGSSLFAGGISQHYDGVRVICFQDFDELGIYHFCPSRSESDLNACNVIQTSTTHAHPKDLFSKTSSLAVSTAFLFNA